MILDKNIRLIDSPGIVFADGNTIATTLRNCVNVEEMIDVLTPIQGILEKCPAQYLMQLYSIPKFNQQDVISFLALIAKATGKLKKGGIPNTDAAARSVLHDWNNGKIKYYCKSPKINNNNTTDNIKLNKIQEKDTKILSSYSEVMDINHLKDEDIRVINDLYPTNNKDTLEDCEFFIGIDKIGDNMDYQQTSDE